MKLRNDLTFSIEEYQRRLDGVKTRMIQANLEVLMVTTPQNILYLTGFQTSGYDKFMALVIPLEGEPMMILRLLEQTNVAPRTWVERSYGYSDTQQPSLVFKQAMEQSNLQAKRIGFEKHGYFFHQGMQAEVFEQLKSATFIPVDGLVEDLRLIKSIEECEVMQKAAKSCEAGMLAGIHATQVGSTENDIAAKVHHAMFKAQGEYPAVPPYITSGPRCLQGHATWEGRVVQENECVFLELGGSYRRYHTAMMRTLYTGKPPQALLDAEKIVIEALTYMKEALVPGAIVEEVDKKVRAINDKAKSTGGTMIARSAYSIGIAFAPSWDEGNLLSFKAGEKRELQENMTLHCIPWLYKVGGQHVMAISDTLQVTPQGGKSFYQLAYPMLQQEPAHV